MTSKLPPLYITHTTYTQRGQKVEITLRRITREDGTFGYENRQGQEISPQLLNRTDQNTPSS